MKSNKPKNLDAREFVTSDAYHWPRMQMSVKLLIVAALLLPLGLYLIVNDLPDTSSQRAQIIFNGTPTIVGAMTLIYGCFGAVTAGAGMARKGAKAIDLIVKPSGITVRGGHKIPWDSIVSVTSIRFENDSKVQLLWDRADLHRSLNVYFDSALDIPSSKVKEGKSFVRVNLFRYPALEYANLYKVTLDQFERRGIPVDDQKKTVLT
ncbi:MAG: hypothetical protein ABWX63_00130 [Paeniglutamicibacter terrestris]